MPKFSKTFYREFLSRLIFFRNFWLNLSRYENSGPVQIRPEKFENGVFTLTDASNVFRPHCAGRRNLKTQQSPVTVDSYLKKNKLGGGNHLIIVKSSFSISCVFKVFSVHTKTQSRRFQIPPV